MVGCDPCNETQGFLHFYRLLMVMGPISFLGLKTFILPWVVGVQRMVRVGVDDGWMSLCLWYMCR